MTLDIIYEKKLSIRGYTLNEKRYIQVIGKFFTEPQNEFRVRVFEQKLFIF